MDSIFLQGNNLYLRRLLEEDLKGDYYHWLNDQEVTQWMQNGIFPNSMESMEQFYRSNLNSKTDIVLAIVADKEHRHVGNIGLHRIHPIFRSAEIGILIGDKQYWGKGIATEAIHLIVRHAFMRLNINRLYAGAVIDNHGSIRAFEKAGFQREGIHREAYYCEGQFRDCIQLSLLRKDWLPDNR